MAVQIQTLNILSESQFPPEQAQGLARAFDVEKDVWRQGLATREDLNEVKTELAAFKTEIKSELITLKTELRSELRSELTATRHDLEIKIEGVRSELKGDIAEVRHELVQLEMRLFMKMAAMMATTITVILAVLRIFRTAF